MRAQPDRPGIVAPPPLLALAAILLGLGVDRFLPLPPWPGAAPGLRLGIAIALFVLAVTMSLAAVLEMRRHRTTPDPYKPTTAIVSSGIFSRTRNPIYLGFLLTVAAAALGFDSAWVAIALLPLYLVLELGVIRREERYLAAKFGAPYDEYRARVRRWL